MSQCELNPDQCFDSIGTLDIETSGFDGATEDLIAVGVGYYEPNADAEVAVHTQLMFDGDERELIRNAYDWLNDREPECLATFNGAGFDFDFLVDKCDALGYRDRPDLLGWPNHVDLLSERKQRLPPNRKWPSLEESLNAYEIPKYETTWNGKKLTNTRFGEELAPRYVDALASSDAGVLDELESVVVEYTESDIEANIALYEADAGREYLPTYAQ